MPDTLSYADMVLLAAVLTGFATLHMGSSASTREDACGGDINFVDW